MSQFLNFTLLATFCPQTFLLSKVLCVCVCVSAPQALLDLLFAQHTITFLLSDRVSRHTRDRARQCALETGDGARAPKPSASFTDSLILPLEIAVGGSLSLPRKLRVRYELGIILTLRKKKKKVRLCVETGRNARLLDECSLSLRALETQLNLGERFRPGFLLPGSSQPGQTTSSADDWHIWTIADKQTNK